MTLATVPRRQAVAAGVAAGVLALTAACGLDDATQPSAPEFASAPNAVFTVGAPADFSISASGATGTISLSGKLPAGLTLKAAQNGAARLTGTAAQDAGGKYTLAFHAHNASGDSAQTFTLTVDEAPAFTTTDQITDIAYKGDFTPIKASGYPPPTITISGSLPHGLAFKSTGPGTAQISGTPGGFTSSPYGDVTLTAHNVAGTTTQDMSIYIVNAPGLCLLFCGLLAGE